MQNGYECVRPQPQSPQCLHCKQPPVTGTNSARDCHGLKKYSRLKLSLKQLLMPDLDSDPVTARCEGLMEVSRVPSTKSARNLSI